MAGGGRGGGGGNGGSPKVTMQAILVIHFFGGGVGRNGGLIQFNLFCFNFFTVVDFMVPLRIALHWRK